MQSFQSNANPRILTFSSAVCIFESNHRGLFGSFGSNPNSCKANWAALALAVFFI